MPTSPTTMGPGAAADPVISRSIHAMSSPRPTHHTGAAGAWKGAGLAASSIGGATDAAVLAATAAPAAIAASASSVASVAASVSTAARWRLK